MTSRAAAWLEGEPVITRVGPVIGVIVVYLAAKGVLDQDTADLVTAIVGVLLGGGAIVGTRAAVTPVTGCGDGDSADRRTQL
ncbi:hypothetical protein AB0L97_33035 [Nocardia sp. NPDC051911]|uniref:hypothetical protein n=1 Tax=Nocardia sp. NPDC051911 TaxID=3154648 RepID=UPI003424CF6D